MKQSNFLRMLVVALSFVLPGTIAQAQVVVTATAGVTGPTFYTTVGAAFADINAGLPQGAIAVAIQSSTIESGPCVLNASGAGAASYTAVTVVPIVDGVTISGATPSGRGLIELNGADNVVIEGDNPNTSGVNRDLTLLNTAANTTTFTSVVRVALSSLINSGDNNVVRNCILVGSATGRNNSAATSTSGSENTTYGILVGGNASTVSSTTAPDPVTSVTATVGAGITAANFMVTNNIIDGCARGIAVNGSATSVVNVLTITGNTIGSATSGNTTTVYSRGISVQGFSAAAISGNTVRNIEFYASTACMAISIGDVSPTGTNAVIENNVVGAVVNRHPGTYGAYGINLAGGTSHTVRNNFVQGINHDMSGGFAFSTTFGVIGIRIFSGTGHSIYYNSVHLYGSMLGTPNSTLLSACLAIVNTGLTGLTVQNNIFSNKLTGGTTSVVATSIYLPSGGSSGMNLTLNNNFYYEGTTAGQSGIAQVSTTYSTSNLYTAANFIQNSTTPSTNLRAYTSTLSAAGTNDDASWASSASAPFISNTDLHINLSASNLTDLDARAAVVAGIPTDIDGNVRDASTPDIGAHEFTIPNCSTADGGTITPSIIALCAGETLAMNSTGASVAPGITYQWMVGTTSGGPYANVTGGTGATTVFYTTDPLTAGTYYYVLQATCTFGPVSDFSNEVTVTVNALPVVVANASANPVCIGDPLTLSGSGAATYTWSAGVTDGVAFTPASTSTYTVTGTDGNGCESIDSVTVPVNPLPVVTLTGDTTFCAGDSTLLTGSSGGTSQWYLDGQPIAGATNNTYYATMAGVYNMIKTNQTGCSDSASTGITVTVNALPAVTAGSTASIVCAGDSVTLAGSGASSYAWTGGVTDNVAFVPSATGTYTVTGTDSNGCMDTATILITVNPLPAVTANATSTSICAGDSLTLTGGGATTYTWSGGVNDGVAFVPSATDSYTVTGTDANGCVNVASVTVAVNALPAVVANASDTMVCEGSPVTLTGSGASTYTWSGGIYDGMAFNASATATYTVTGIDSNGCSGTDSVSVTVNALPVVTYSIAASMICFDDADMTLTAGTPAGGTWSGTGVSGNSFDPSVAGAGMAVITYAFTDSLGCTGTASDSILVDPCSGIATSEASSTITIFPNPNEGRFTIRLGAVPASPVQVEMTNELGQLIDAFTMTDTTKEINISQLEGGVYFIRVINGNVVSVHRVVKQ